MLSSKLVVTKHLQFIIASKLESSVCIDTADIGIGFGIDAIVAKKDQFRVSH